jgi:sugar lactone lactonase YvrE
MPKREIADDFQPGNVGTFEVTMPAMDRQHPRSWQRVGLVLGAAWLALLAGCATQKTAAKYIFYPPPPASPRLQFLASFSDEKDLGLEVSPLATFIAGVTPRSQPIVKPYGVLMASNQIFVCDTGTRSVDILDLVRKTMSRFSPADAGKFGTPVNLAMDADGTRYVADTGRNRVLVFRADAAFLGAIGEDDSLRPTGVALGADRIYITDLKGHCVRVYEKADRKFLFTIPRTPEAEEEHNPGKLFMPVNLALDRRGRLYVSDIGSCRIQIYDAEGKHLRSLGDRGDLPGQFARPKGLAVDREDRLYVVDAATQVCQIFDADGKLLLFFGEQEGSQAPLNLPAGVTVDYDNLELFQKYAAPDFVLEHLVIIANQYGPKKISVYGLGHKR